jgi:hypothetical protein
VQRCVGEGGPFVYRIEPPSEEVVQGIKNAGFRYRPEYFDQQKVWTCPNNYEGREQVDRLEAYVTGLSGGRTPF